MNSAQAIRDIRSVLGALRILTSQDKAHLRSLSQGKLYELYVLAHLVGDLRRRGFRLWHCGSNIHFKQAPGKLYMNDPHFVIHSRYGPYDPEMRLFVNIEFQTLGRDWGTQVDLSTLHELDLVVVKDPTDSSNPSYRQILLAVECKSNAFLKKSFVREALGLRRELSYLTGRALSHLSYHVNTQPVWVPAFPASEFWLAFSDPGGTRYRQSPAAFGVELKHIQP